MDFSELQSDSNLEKNTSQIIQPQGAVYAAVNPSTPANSPSTSSQPGGAPEVLTGTVITSCFIQTSALPYRAQLQDNALTFFDDTTTQNGMVIGHTSRLIFTHNSGISGTTVTQGFIWEKRASTINSYDNVLSLYAYPAINDPVAHANTMNYLFFGQQGSFGDPEYNVNVIQFIVNHDNATTTKPSQNGEFNVAGSTNGAEPLGLNIAVQHNSLLGVAGDGFSVFIGGSGTGIVEVAGAEFAITGTVIDFNGLTITQGAGSPQSVVTADPGSLYLNTNGGSGTTLYTKESGSGDTGWTAVGSGGGSTPLIKTLTGVPASGATSMTFTPALSGIPAAGYYIVAFNGSGEVRSIFLSNGSTTVTWGYPLQISSGTNQVTVHLS
jgi:hypothetical protein